MKVSDLPQAPKEFFGRSSIQSIAESPHAVQAYTTDSKSYVSHMLSDWRKIRLIWDAEGVSVIQTKCTMPDYKALLLEFNKNLQILQEREARYAGNSPLDLINQIEDHRMALNLTEQVIAGELNEAQWETALKPLLVNIRARKSEDAHTAIGAIEGDLTGYVAGRDIHITYNYSDTELRAEINDLKAVIVQQEETLRRRGRSEDQIEARVTRLKEQVAALQTELAARAEQSEHLSYRTPDPTILEAHYLRRLQAEVSHLSLLHIDPNAAENQMELAKVYIQDDAK